MVLNILFITSVIINICLIINYYMNKHNNRHVNLSIHENDIDNASEIINILIKQNINNIIFRDENCKTWNNANCHVAHIADSADEILIIDLIKK